ncbi:RNA polymerase sigma factor [Chondromyces crocatus]|uniref:RNA polymerase sigma factor RpoE n=1 Tax=Chondromyces crocatus TaxID=52 RepID=A0A0K1E7T0_CHOCO|nr:RNA polymerase sigma factor [Chondromyces crocatus]AKT36737.1 RNA polymerase sigma factor RpoE [Chondromyces crocatus]
MTAPRSSTLGTTRAQFEAAVRPVLPRLYRYCVSLSGDHDRADDLFQNAILKAFLNAATYEGRSDLAGWLCGIARNEYLEQRRTEARRRGLFERFMDACTEALGLAPDDAKAPDAALIHAEDTDLVLACLQQLPEDFRTVIVLCDIEELGHDEVAALLSIPKGTVKSRHARGRARLREVYERMVAQGGLPAREEST